MSFGIPMLTGEISRFADRQIGCGVVSDMCLPFNPTKRMTISIHEHLFFRLETSKQLSIISCWLYHHVFVGLIPIKNGNKWLDYRDYPARSCPGPRQHCIAFFLMRLTSTDWAESKGVRPEAAARKPRRGWHFTIPVGNWWTRYASAYHLPLKSQMESSN